MLTIRGRYMLIIQSSITCPFNSATQLLRKTICQHIYMYIFCIRQIFTFWNSGFHFSWEQIAYCWLLNMKHSNESYVKGGRWKLNIFKVSGRRKKMCKLRFVKLLSCFIILVSRLLPDWFWWCRFSETWQWQQMFVVWAPWALARLHSLYGDRKLSWLGSKWSF